jgi:flap endonuclease-1
MGIKNLKVLLNSKCNHAIQQRNLSCYNGMIIGIDLSIFLYKYLYNNSDHIEGLTRLILRLLKNNIIPIFVFDGKPPPEKEEILMERRLKKEFMHMKKEIYELIIKFKDFPLDVITNLINMYIKNHNQLFKIDQEHIHDMKNKTYEEIREEIEKINRKIINIKSVHIQSAKELFRLFGISYIDTDCEAESMLAFMNKNNMIDACITEDMDILAGGGKIFLKNFSADKNIVDEYCLDGILETLELTHDEFIDLCILSGCDYTPKISGMGSLSAYKLVKKYKKIETILPEIKINSKYIVPENFNYQDARRLFHNTFDLNILKDVLPVKIREPNLKELLLFLDKTSLNIKYKYDIELNLMNYYLNIISINKLDSINRIIYSSISSRMKNYAAVQS